MSRFHSAEERAAAVARVTAGERPSAVARTLGIDESTLRGWRKAARGPRAPKRRPTPTTPPAEAPLRTVDVPAEVRIEPPAEPAPSAAPGGTAGGAGPSPDADAEGDLERALRAAGVKPEPAPEPGGAKADAPQGPPAPTPAQLVLLVEVVLFLAVRSVCAAKNVAVSRVELADLSRFRPDEREMLELLAPYAAPYAPQVLEYVEKAAAIGFVAVFGLVVAQRVKDVESKPKRNAPPKATPPRAPEPAPEPAPAAPFSA